MDKVEPTATVIPSIKCRYCKGDHWSAKCPLKDILQDKIDSKAESAAAAVATAAGGAGGKSAYVPPSMRAGASTTSKFGSKFDSGKGGAFANKGNDDK